MTISLEYFDSIRLKLWRQKILRIYDTYRDVFEEYRLDEDLRSLLDNLDYLLDILSVEISYYLKIARLESSWKTSKGSEYILRGILEELLNSCIEMLGK